MNWNLFYITFAVAFLLSAPMFKLLNGISILQGYVPESGNQWHGRRFAYWKEETTLYIGNPFFFSLMDALIAASIPSIQPNIGICVWTFNSFILGALATYFWFRNATQLYKTGQINSFGWQWCSPNQISTAGWYHTAYFFIHAIAISSVLTIFLFQPISSHIKAGMIFAIIGYFATFRHFVFVQQRLDSMQEGLEKAQQQT